MKKKAFWLIISLLLILGAFLFGGFLYDTAETLADGDRIIPIYCVDTEEKKIALTFDAAWGNEDTDLLIEILKKYNAPATFFMTGQWVDNYPDDVKKFWENGHDIANHSDVHPHIAELSQEALKEDTDRCNEKIAAITGSTPLLYRGPYGEYNNSLIEMLHQQNMFYIQWDVDSLDWKNPEPDQLAKNVTEKVQNGSIILLHNGAKNTPEALPVILETLTEKGYQFVLVKDLIYKGNYKTDHAGKQVKDE